jgi:hypothetical protein
MDREILGQDLISTNKQHYDGFHELTTLPLPGQN